MAGIASLGSVGAGLSEAQFQVQYQVQALKEQQQVAEDVGAASLELIKAAMSTMGQSRNDLDVLA